MNAGFCFFGQARGACPYVYCRGVKFYAPTPLTPLLRVMGHEGACLFAIPQRVGYTYLCNNAGDVCDWRVAFSPSWEPVLDPVPIFFARV